MKLMSNLNCLKTFFLRTCLGVIFFHLIFFSLIDVANAQEQTNVATSTDKRVEELETMLKQILLEIELLKGQQKKGKQLLEKQNKELSGLEKQVEAIEQSDLADDESLQNKFRFGGYGEMHANFNLDTDEDIFDIHRLVFYLGYDFSDWIRFHSEIELEHAFVSDDSGGELGLEQAYIELLLNDAVNVEVGRILTPMGIINRKHEPTSFNGVERPAYAKYIIPTTWSSDGIGVLGSLAPWLGYEAYIVGGLDGSRFNALDGIRKGRIKERSSLNQPALTGRFDFYPLLKSNQKLDQMLRLGLSYYFGGLNNGNDGKNPGIDGDIQIYSADVEYSKQGFDIRGEIAYENIDGAETIGNGTASAIFGWYLETAYHFLPDGFKQGRWKSADAVAFVRYDDFDTQYKMPSGIPKNPAGDRKELTIGFGFYPISNLVFKADYQIRKNESDQDPGDLFNLGVGWQF